MKTCYFLSLISLFILCSCTPKKDLASARWELNQTTGFPSQEEGLENGVSACYVGALGSKLIMAGGCNFPDVPASEGGKKKFYKGIYAADITADSVLNWRKVGELPLASAYGVAAVYNDLLICAGGTDGTRSLTDVFSIRLKEDAWNTVIRSSRLARAGAVLVSGGNGSFYNINGELKPGIRTPEITRIWLK